MTDKELLDGLQLLIEEKVTVVRTCRSGLKIVVADGSLEYFLTDDRDWSPAGPVRTYFGGGGCDGGCRHVGSSQDDEFGPDHGSDIRIAIARAVKGEAAYPVGKLVVK